MNVILAPPPVRKRRWFLRVVVLLLVVAVGAVALAPSLLEWSPALRNRVAKALLGKANGELVVDSLSAGWFEPLIIRGVRVVHPSGESLVEIERIEADRVLWKMLWTPSDLGTLRIERPTVNLALRSDGNNFDDVFAPMLGAPVPPMLLKVGARARVVDATFNCRSSEHADPWAISGINLGVGWRPASRSPSGKAELLVDRGLLLDEAELSVGLCKDILSFVAPVLADVAFAQGRVTVELDDWRLPWDDLASGELSGRVTMHTVDAAPGPLVKQLFGTVQGLPILSALTSQWQLPTGVQLARDSTIPFEMIDGRIHHEGLRFSLYELFDVQTAGYVGLDETLDLTATLGFHPPNPEQRFLALLRVVNSQPWPVRIHGKLGQPIIDFSPLPHAAVDLGIGILDDYESGRPSLGGNLLRRANEAGIPVTPELIKGLIELARPQTETPANLDVTDATPQPRAPAPVPPVASASPTAPAPTPPLPTPPQPRETAQLPPVATPTATAPPSGPLPPAAAQGIGVAVDVLQAIRERREAAEKAAAGLPPEAPPPPPRRPLLRQGLRMLLDAADEATSPPTAVATPTSTPPPPPPPKPPSP